MPRAASAKVFNEDLVRALEHRSNDAASRNNLRVQTMWQNGAYVIEAVSAEIYMTKSTSMPKNLPNAGRNFPKTVRDECEMIMRGTREIYPAPKRPINNAQAANGNNSTFREGPSPAAAAAAAATPPFNQNPPPEADPGYRHAYLNSMFHGEGGYALLLAFHHHPKPGRMHHYRKELIRDAQPYCNRDCAMEPNYFVGRTHAAGWKSIDSLVKHRLVHRTSHSQGRAQAGWGGGPRDEFTLTEEGRRFVMAMLNKWPESREQKGQASNSAARSTGAGGGGQRWNGTPSANVSSTPMTRPTTSSKLSMQDEEELLSWMSNLKVPGQQREFRVSKARRTYLHQLVDHLQQNERYILSHQSKGNGPSRALVVTFEGRGSTRTETPLSGGNFSQHEEEEPFSAGYSGVAHTPASKKRMFDEIKDSNGHRLGGSNNTSALDPRKSAFLAAEKRNNDQQAIKRGQEGFELALRTSQHDESQDQELKTALAASLADSTNSTNENVPSETFCRQDDTSEDEELKLGIAASLAEVSSSQTIDDSIEVVDVALACGDAKLSLIMDSRERTKNSNPREFLQSINRSLDLVKKPDRMGGLLKNCIVERRQLSAADFAWLLSNGNMANMLIERKKIGDLVGRSAEYGGIAHLEQIGRIRRSGEATHGFLLLEGPLRQVSLILEASYCPTVRTITIYSPIPTVRTITG
jgi:hypothetical protein